MGIVDRHLHLDFENQNLLEQILAMRQEYDEAIDSFRHSSLDFCSAMMFDLRETYGLELIDELRRKGDVRTANFAEKLQRKTSFFDVNAYNSVVREIDLEIESYVH